MDQALQIALSENVAVKVSDLEIKRTEYAKKGAYASLFPQIDVAGSYQRTIKKQVMYMAMGDQPMKIEVGMFNTLNAAATAALPLVNAQLWKSLQISALDVELAVEKARASRLDMVTQVKNAYFGILLAKEAFNVYMISSRSANARMLASSGTEGKGVYPALFTFLYFSSCSKNA